MRTQVTDFEGQYKIYSVYTLEGGPASRFDDQSCGVEITGEHQRFLSTAQALSLYNDTQYLAAQHADGWPGKVRLISADIRMITLSLNFNEIIKMGARLSQAHGGVPLSSLTDGGAAGPLAAEFAIAAAKNGLTPLGHYFVTSQKTLESFAHFSDTPQTELDLGEMFMNCPNETMGIFTDATTILPSLHRALLLNEIDFPGYASGNRYYITGLFTTAESEAALPLPPQSGAPEEPAARVFAELQRTLG